MYAIIEIAGKQFKVREKDTLYVPFLQDARPEENITLARVLLLADGDNIQVGTPTVEGASATASVLEHVKADKIVVFKKKRRKRYRVKRGHRQTYTHIRIASLSAGEQS